MIISIYFWRLIYGLANTPLVVRLLAVVYKLGKQVGYEPYARLLVHHLACLITLHLHSRPGRVNLQAQRLYWRALHYGQMTAMVPSKPHRSSDHYPLRVGIFGQLAATLLTQKPFFDGVSNNVDLYIFDRKYLNYSSGYLKGISKQYLVFEDNVDQIQPIAQAIQQTDLDVLVNITSDLFSFDVLDRVNTPCIVHLCSGSDILHHEKVSYQIHGQPEAEYFPQDGYIFCAYTRQRFSDQRVYQGRFVYDTRDIELDQQVTWSSREPLIFWHGSLYKLASRNVLDIIFRVMEDDSRVEFVFMGRDDQSKKGNPMLPFIRHMSQDRGVAARVHYEGNTLAGRTENGDVAGHKGWQKLKSYLSRARLWPDTFPIGGGFARVEAYAAGVPSVHMGVCFNTQSWGKPQLNAVEVPALLVSDGTATTVLGYENLCRKCLYDESFADALSTQEITLASRLNNGRVFWQQFVEFYQDWRAKVVP